MTAKKTPAKKAVRKTPAAKKPATRAKEPEARPLVEPLNSQMFKFLMELIDNAPIAGRDAMNVLALKQEVARVAGVRIAP
jgi:hypothetical protein